MKVGEQNLALDLTPLQDNKVGYDLSLETDICQFSLARYERLVV